MPDNIGQMFYYGEIPWHKRKPSDTTCDRGGSD